MRQEYTAATRLVVAPHMDDETFGCGGLLARYCDESFVLTVAAGTEQRRREHAAAMDILGIGSYACLEMEDGAVSREERRLTDRLDQAMSAVRPAMVYLPFPSAHQDHLAVYQAGIRSCRISMHADHWYPDNVYLYDVNAYDIDFSPREHPWNSFLELREAEIDKKMRAALAYETEIPSTPHPAKAIRETAVTVGAMRRVPLAEQFSLVREVVH